MELDGKFKIEGDPFTVELERGMKGVYGWTIKVRGAEQAIVMYQLEAFDAQLRKLYGPKETLVPGILLGSSPGEETLR